MHKTSVRYTRVEVEMLIKEQKKKRDTLREDLRKTNKQIDRLEKLITKQYNTEPHSKVSVPIELLSDHKANHDNSKWKRIAVELLEEYDQAMTGQIAYKKLLLKNHCNHNKRKFIQRNLCSAFYYLFHEDGKLLRCKNPYGRGYVYGLIHFFDLSANTLKPKYDQKLKRELDVVLKEEPDASVA